MTCWTNHLLPGCSFPMSNSIICFVDIHCVSKLQNNKICKCCIFYVFLIFYYYYLFIYLYLAPYCSLNPTLRNGGIVNKTGGPAGSKVHYYCKPGYRMIGQNNATCRRHQNGMYQWDSPVPICRGKICFLIEHSSII